MGSSCCSCQGRLPNLEEDLHISNLELIDEVNDLRKLHKEDIEASKIYYQGQAIFRGTLNRNKQKEGYGEYFNQDKVFFGIFANDMPSGPGLAVKNDESYYSGHFEDGTFHGFGKEYGPNYFF